MLAARQQLGPITAFLANYQKLLAGENGLLPESNIQPVASLPQLSDLPAADDPQALLSRAAVIKLNGGLGTGMGLDAAKSLLEIKDSLTFLDLIARQVLYLRESLAPGLKFLLMNSFSTSEDTLKFLSKYPDLGNPESLEFLQSQAPKLDAATLLPVAYPENPLLEWCPPGHGDIYSSLAASGQLERLLADGIEYAFISNSDNLGATLDPRLLAYMQSHDLPFLMEVTRRTPADRKGGHLANVADSNLVLRESAQCPESDTDSFQNIERHRYFNTNNIWLNLKSLRAQLNRHEGALPLPFIRNDKTVDPKQPESTKVIQLETAMGAAICLFEGAAAIEVPRSRFAPVKKTNDLLLLRSDAAEIREDWTLGIIEARTSSPPEVTLSSHYKLISDFERLIPQAPSLINADKLTLNGAITLTPGTNIQGTVEVTADQPATLPAGTYANQSINLSAS